MLKPGEIAIQPTGVLLDTLGRVEVEAVAALIVRWHQVHGHAEWTPVSRRDIGAMFESDQVVQEWASNPFWRLDPYGFAQQGFITGWDAGPDAKGELTPAFHEALERRAQKDRDRGQHVITRAPEAEPKPEGV